MRVVSRLSLALIIAMGLPLSIVQADIEQVINECDSCHGKDGVSMDEMMPNIGGLSAGYITDTMNSYASDERKGEKYQSENGEESDMNTEAKELSDDEIAAVAKHYAGLPFVVHQQAADAAKAAAGAKLFDKNCEKCHSEGGSLADDDAGILKGQWKAYLTQQFALFSDGSREMPKKMKKKFEKLSDEDKTALLEFLAAGK